MQNVSNLSEQGARAVLAKYVICSAEIKDPVAPK